MFLAALSGSWFLWDYDTSTHLHDTSIISANSSFFWKLLRWDAVFFLDIASNGYRLEQQFAFFPGFPILMRLVAAFIIDPFNQLPKETSCYLAGLLISNTCFCLAAWTLVQLAHALSLSPKSSFIAGLLFCISPASVFLSSCYTESLFAYLSFQGMLYYVERKPWKAAFVWACSSFVRSNGIVYAGFFVWSSLQQPRGLILHAINLLRILVVITPMLFFQWVGYWTFCMRNSLDDRPSWCNSTLPLIYSHVQSTYWNNGFLRYWTLAQIPNFIIALPSLIINLKAIADYVKYDWKRFCTMGMVRNENVKDPIPLGFYTIQLLPFVYLTSFLLFYLLFFMHVQIIVRFFTCIPIAYLYLAENLNAKKNSWGYWYVTYALGYATISTILFSVFLPPA
jgi:phosphatidylinositol glycan class V